MVIESMFCIMYCISCFHAYYLMIIPILQMEKETHRWYVTFPTSYSL